MFPAFKTKISVWRIKTHFLKKCSCHLWIGIFWCLKLIYKKAPLRWKVEKSFHFAFQQQVTKENKIQDNVHGSKHVSCCFMEASEEKWTSSQWAAHPQHTQWLRWCSSYLRHQHFGAPGSAHSIYQELCILLGPFSKPDQIEVSCSSAFIARENNQWPHKWTWQMSGEVRNEELLSALWLTLTVLCVTLWGTGPRGRAGRRSGPTCEGGQRGVGPRQTRGLAAPDQALPVARSAAETSDGRVRTMRGGPCSSHVLITLIFYRRNNLNWTQVLNKREKTATWCLLARLERPPTDDTNRDFVHLLFYNVPKIHFLEFFVIFRKLNSHHLVILTRYSTC